MSNLACCSRSTDDFDSNADSPRRCRSGATTPSAQAPDPTMPGAGPRARPPALSLSRARLPPSGASPSPSDTLSRHSRGLSSPLPEPPPILRGPPPTLPRRSPTLPRRPPTPPASASTSPAPGRRTETPHPPARTAPAPAPRSAPRNTLASSSTPSTGTPSTGSYSPFRSTNPCNAGAKYHPRGSYSHSSSTPSRAYNAFFSLTSWRCVLGDTTSITNDGTTPCSHTLYVPSTRFSAAPNATNTSGATTDFGSPSRKYMNMFPFTDTSSRSA